MKRKLPSLVSCSELHILNKTMIIEVPIEFRKPGEPVFRIVSSLDDDLENPKLKFKANYILKTILEKGTDGKKLDSICIEEGSLQSPQISHEKPPEEFLNDKVSDDQQYLKTKLTHSKLSEKSANSNCRVPVSAVDGDAGQTSGQFDVNSKTSLTECDNSSDSLGLYKENWKSSSLCTTNHVSALDNFKKVSDCKTVQQLSRPIHKISQGQANCSKPFEVLENEDLRPFRKLPNCDKNLRYPQELNTYDSWSVKGRGYQDQRSQQQMDYYNCIPPEQKNQDFVFPQQANTGLFQHHTDFKDLCQHAGQNYRSLDYEDQNLKELRPYGSKITEQASFDYSDAIPKNVPCNQNFSWPKCGAPYGDINETSDSSSRQTDQNTGYISYQNDGFHHQEGQKPRTLVQIPRANIMRPQFSQVSSANVSKLPNEVLPKHVFQKNPDLSEVKQIIFLDVASIPNFFLDFVRILPTGTHIWVLMHSRFYLKFPQIPTPATSRLLNLKLLHAVLGNINYNFPIVLSDLHQKLPLNVPFLIVSNRQFSVVGLIAAANRTVKFVTPRLNENISHVYAALQS